MPKVLDDGIACDKEELTCVTMQLLEERYTQEMNDTWDRLCDGKSSAASFLLLIKQGQQGPKLIAKLSYSVDCIYRITALIPVPGGEITHIHVYGYISTIHTSSYTC